MGVKEDAVSSDTSIEEFPMPTQPAPPLPAFPPPRKTTQPSEASTPAPDAPTPKAAEEGAIFRALLDAGAEAMVAYTAERRVHTMVSEAVAPQLQPFLAEVRRRFDEQDRRLAEHDRKLDVIVARLDGMKVLGQVILGALALLITALIAVFGFLFAN